MKLFFSPNSPFARKCRVVILEKGLQDAVEMISVMPADNPPELIAANPLGSVPTLVMENGEALCESPVICQYLDSLSKNNPLRTMDIHALGIAALADGIMDAAVAIVMENRRPEEKRYEFVVQRKETAIMRSIAKISELNLDSWNIGVINVAIALAYVSFRLPQLAWRDEHKNLASLLDFINEKPSMVATAPVF